MVDANLELDIDNSSYSFRSNGDDNRVSSVGHILATDETVSGFPGDGSDVIATKMLGDLKDETVLSFINLKCIPVCGGCYPVIFWR